MRTGTLVVKYKYFKSLLPWKSVFDAASEFAADVGRERLIGISQSHTGFQKVGTVWYWGERGEA